MNNTSHNTGSSAHSATNPFASLSANLAELVDRIGESVYAVLGRRGDAIASAVLWRDDILVTTAHGFRRAPSELTVVDASGQVLTAIALGTDSSTDLAVFRLSQPGGKAAPLGDAVGLRTGNLVVAIGRSASGDVTASYGLVNRSSGAWQTWQGGHLDRQIRLDGGLYGGQSGGAIIDASGQVIGIGSAALARGYGMVIPGSNITRVVDSLLTHGHVARPYLGIGAQAVELPVQSNDATVNQAIPNPTSSNPTGLLVTALAAQGPAKAAGVLVGDILVSAQGHALGSLQAMRSALSGRVNEAVSFDLIRGGVPRQLSIKVAPWPTSTRSC